MKEGIVLIEKNTMNVNYMPEGYFYRIENIRRLHDPIRMCWNWKEFGHREHKREGMYLRTI